MSRSAAEEVYKGVRDKVNRMGGVGAWRERERRRGEWRGGWDEEVNGGWDGRGKEEVEGEEGGEAREKREEREQYEGEVSEYNAREEGGRKMDPLFEEGRDDDVSLDGRARGEVERRKLIVKQTFTMDMMLRQLHVELNVIGYDKEEQRWLD